MSTCAATAGAYFWLLGSLSCGSNMLLLVGAVGGVKWGDSVLTTLQIPEGVAGFFEVGADKGEAVPLAGHGAEERVVKGMVQGEVEEEGEVEKEVEVPVEVTNAAAVALFIGVTAATTDVVLGHDNLTLNNFLVGKF
jgi:hypothetical protein